MKSLLVLGYRDFELSIFKDDDPKIGIIKYVIKKKLISFLDEGLEWLIFTGNKGFEFWVYEVALELKKEYDLKLATIFSFKTHGKNWNEAGQKKLEIFRNADFVQYAYDEYENPGQFKQYNNFLIDHTDGIFSFYDDEYETNLKYFMNLIKNKKNYENISINFEELEEAEREIFDNF